MFIFDGGFKFINCLSGDHARNGTGRRESGIALSASTVPSGDALLPLLTIRCDSYKHEKVCVRTEEQRTDRLVKAFRVCCRMRTRDRRCTGLWHFAHLWLRLYHLVSGRLGWRPRISFLHQIPPLALASILPADAHCFCGDGLTRAHQVEAMDGRPEGLVSTYPASVLLYLHHWLFPRSCPRDPGVRPIDGNEIRTSRHM